MVFRGVEEAAACPRCGALIDRTGAPCAECKIAEKEAAAARVIPLARPAGKAWFDYSLLMLWPLLVMASYWVLAKSEGNALRWPAAIGGLALLGVDLFVLLVVFGRRNRRTLAFVGDRFELRDGRGRVVFSAPLADAIPEPVRVYGGRSGVSGERWWHHALRFAKHGDKPFTVRSTETTGIPEDVPDDSPLPRVRFPRFTIEHTPFKRILKRFGLPIPLVCTNPDHDHSDELIPDHEDPGPPWMRKDPKKPTKRKHT